MRVAIPIYLWHKFKEYLKNIFNTLESLNGRPLICQLSDTCTDRDPLVGRKRFVRALGEQKPRRPGREVVLCAFPDPRVSVR